MNWEAVRAEYLAGGIGQSALAKKHGVSGYALAKRAREEGWARQRAGGSNAQGDADDDVLRARRTRRALLAMLERAAKAVPCDATEVKSTGDGGEVKLLKLRDLTAAYKELVGDLALDPEGTEQKRVVIDI